VRHRWLIRGLCLAGWAQFVAIIAITIGEKILERLTARMSELAQWYRVRVRWRIQEFVQLRLRRLGLKWVL
jgi:hypothetical protein